MLAAPPLGRADIEDETALAERYAPIVRLVAQEEECGFGEPYAPLDVEDLLEVSARSPSAARGAATT